MHAKVIGPDRSCDGWRVVLAEEVDPVYVVAGNGATREQAIRAAIRETFVLLGTLARLLDDAIFARMKGNNRQSSTTSQNL